MITFEIKAKQGKARAGTITLANSHGTKTLQTPVFMPVATQGTVKALPTRDMETIGVQGLLSNAYHLYLRPGTDVIAKVGGLHRFMDFKGVIITDSGGYQIFSLSKLRKIKKDGVQFQSPIDGSTHFLTPESIIDIQKKLASDIFIPLDECVHWPCTPAEAESALATTFRWLKSTFHHKESSSHLREDTIFPIVQGSTFKDLRKTAAEQVLSFRPEGIAIGGVSVGEPREVREEVVGYTTSFLPDHLPRYLMGVGKPEDLLYAVEQGVDIFDCVMPTRCGRTGTAFTDQGKLLIRNACYTADERPLDENCQCYTCRHFSRAYLRHLDNAGEMTGGYLVSYHNVHWYIHFMNKIRKSILEGTFNSFKQEFISNYIKL